MKMHVLLLMCLGAMSAAGASFAQEQPPSAVPPTVGPPPISPGPEFQTRVLLLKHYPVNELADIIRAISGEYGTTVIADEQSNRLILTASSQQMQSIERLIAELDTAGARALRTPSLLYRIYMLEIPSKDQHLKPFVLVLRLASRLSSPKLLEAMRDDDLQIGAVYQRDEHYGPRDEVGPQLLIQGRAASDEHVARVVAKIPESELVELRWDDEAFTAGLAAAQVTRLPGPLQEQLRKLLGEEVQAVGYWFGTLSFPGETEAPIGPWRLELKARPVQTDDLLLEIRVMREPPSPFIAPTTILSNSVQGKIGKPIIIGYNRESYGTRKMGAMVILPEADTTASDTPAGKDR